jgi:putative transposase
LPGDRPLGGRGLAPDQKKARDDGAHVVLIDESGFFLNPTVRRTWAPKGQTPVLTGFGRHRQKVSTIAALSVAPGRRRLGLYWKTDPKDYIEAQAVVSFLRGLLRHLKGKVIVVWDGGSNHKGPSVRALLERYPRLTVERLPGYAPDLNPVEMIWSYLKSGLMADFVPRHVQHLDRVVRGHLAGLGRAPALIRALWAGSKLPLPDKNPPT